MTAEIESRSMIARLIELVASWFRHRREVRELRALTADELAAIAQELRVTPVELDALVQQGAHSADKLPKLLKALGIDEEKLARAEPALLQDMSHVCAACVEKSRCNRELENGTAAQHCGEYCTNSPTIDALAPSWRPKPDTPDYLLYGFRCC
jgi:transcriptional regulator with XRE-family HTH domain